MDPKASTVARFDPVEEAIFWAASALEDLPTRTMFLDRACGSDKAMRTRMEALLAADARAKAALGGDLLDLNHETASAVSPQRSGGEDTRGLTIGRYRILEQIGEGGMGMVYRAEQHEPVRRQVAVKVIRPGLDTRQVIARFEAERQALALMDHPNIARKFDGGLTDVKASCRNSSLVLPFGRPFFVMELVPGVPITEFCAKNRLTVGQRIRLFIPVCRAVQHAHQKGIIHRDLKPSNVLVTLQDGAPVPKIIDFGVSKATDQRLLEHTAFTRYGSLIGTPAYMSPEQAAVDPAAAADVDTRSDIYSLGVLLYELLTGTPPFLEERLCRANCRDLQQILLHEKPERPSARLHRIGAAASLHDAIPKPQENARLSSDLDWIALKCLEKDRNRRYETANGLAADLTRFLADEPIVARPPSVWYGFRKTVRRHRVGFAAMTLVLTALGVSAGVSSWQASRAALAQARAERHLTNTLSFVDRVYSQVGSRLQNLIGGTTANQLLMSNGVSLMAALRADAGDSRAFRIALAQLETQLVFGQSWFGGNTTCDYEGGLRSVTGVIRSLSETPPESLDDPHLRKLARAEMLAGYTALELARNQEAMEHFRAWDRWAERLSRSPVADVAMEGRSYRRWAFGSMGGALLAMGRAGEALTNHFLPYAQDLESRQVSLKSSNWMDLNDLRATASSLGRSYAKLGDAERSLRFLQEAMILNQRITLLFPHRTQEAVEAAIAQAEYAAALMGRGQTEDGLRLLDGALKRSVELAAIDPANLNFVECQAKVLRHSALGWLASARQVTTPATRRRECLDIARSSLDRAENLMAGLPAGCGSRVLRADLDSAHSEVAAARGWIHPGTEPATP